MVNIVSFFSMIWFLLKKNLYDFWDNLFKLALVNIGFIVSLTFPIFVPSLFKTFQVLSLITLIIGLFWCCIYLSAAAFSLKSISDYGSFSFSDFIKSLKKTWVFGLIFGGFVILGYFIVTLVIPFYMSLQSLFGLCVSALIFWAFIVTILALQFLFAVRSRLSTNPIKVLKKCFILFFDNPLFFVFILIHNIIILVFSALTAFLFPGPAGILLFIDESLRLRLLKYDWLEMNPKADRKAIPWGTLLVEDMEKTGSRSFKNFFFPWKD